MKQNNSNQSPADEDSKMKSQMARMVNSYDSYMKKLTLGWENSLREITVNLAQVKSGDCVLEVGCGTGTSTLAAKPQGRLMVLDLALPTCPVSRAIAKILLGFMLKHDLKELLPMMESSGFTGIQISQAKFRVFGFSLLSYVSGVK